MGPLDDVDGTFESSRKEFTDYYRVQSRYDMQEGLARIYGLESNGRVLGYVSIAMSRIRKDVNEETSGKETESNIPAVLISHLAVHKELQRRRIGTKLVNEVLRIARKQSEIIGCRYHAESCG